MTSDERDLLLRIAENMERLVSITRTLHDRISLLENVVVLQPRATPATDATDRSRSARVE